MNIRIIESRAVWDQFIADARPNTFLHSWEWGEFNIMMGDRVWRLGIYNDDNRLAGIALIIRVRARRGSFLFCPHGPIWDIEIFKYKNIKISTAALVDYLKILAKKEQCNFIRFSPLMINTPENNKLWRDLEFREAPIHMHPELAWILDITKPEIDLLQAMRKNTRYAIKKAEKEGIQVIISNNLADFDQFWKVYKATVDRQHFIPFSKNYLTNEFAVFSRNNQALFFFGKYNGEIISAAMIVFQNHSAFYHHGASSHKYTTIAASQLVQWRAIQEAKKRGCAIYNFWGIVPSELKNHPWAGLSLFKRGFGGFAEEYLHAKDFKLNQKYWLAYIVEIVRRFKRRL